MIIKCNSLWSYVIGEPSDTVTFLKDILTLKEFDFDLNDNKFTSFYIDEGTVLDESVIRIPTGLIPFVVKKLNIPVIEHYINPDYDYKEKEVLDICEEVKNINPTFEVRDYQVEAALISLNTYQSLILSSVGSGKEQPCDITIPTPTGFKRFGDLKIGDKVFGKDGKSQTITGIFPQGVKEVYKVSFKNGAVVECGLDHLWTVRKNKNENQVITLRDIQKDYYKTNKKGHKTFNYSVDYSEPVKYNKKDYFIDPYILGVLIGDGTLTTSNIGFSCSDKDSEVMYKVNDKLHKDYHLNGNRYPTCPQYYIKLNNQRQTNMYKSEIKRLKLDVKSHLKHIPEEYLLGSIEQRKALLAGLLDTDGSCKKRTIHSSITYSTSSEKLAKDVQQLVFSLGGFANIHAYNRPNKERIEYILCIETLFNPFTLKRKMDNYIPYLLHNTIIDIQKVRKAECMCIKVSNNDELYLTQDYIPTHNTSIMSMVVKVLKNDKILVMNDNAFILQQIKDRFLSFGIPESEISMDISDLSKHITILTTDIVYSRLKKNKDNQELVNFLGNVNTLIEDECQHMQSISGFLPLMYMNPENLHRVIGYSGSPYRNHKYPYKNSTDMTTIALLGEPAFTYDMPDAISDENIAKVYSYFINYNGFKSFMPDYLDYFVLYSKNIQNNVKRNQAGVSMLAFLNQHNIKTLALFNYVEKHALVILKALKERGIKALMIRGGAGNKKGTPQGIIYEYNDKLEKTEKTGTIDDIKNALKGDYNIILASSILNEGVDISEFDAGILFSGGKSPISIIQQTGRVSRTKKIGMNVSLIIDFKDVACNNMFIGQYNKRRLLMKDKGVENIDNVETFMKLVCQIEEAKKADMLAQGDINKKS